MIGLVARCSSGRIGVVTGRKELPWGLSWVGIGLDDGTRWASRKPTILTAEELRQLGEAAPEHTIVGALRRENKALHEALGLAESFMNHEDECDTRSGGACSCGLETAREDVLKVDVG